METLNPSIIEQIEKAENEDKWDVVCLLLDKVQMKARSRYYAAQEQRLDEKIREQVND